MFPDDMYIADLFKYIPDYPQRTKEATTYPLWLIVIDSLEMLHSITLLVILTTPLWYNNNFQPQLNRQWVDEGITVVGDLLDVLILSFLLRR